MKYSITAYDKAENELKRRREAVMNEHEVHAQEIAQRLPEIEVLTRSLKANKCVKTMPILNVPLKGCLKWEVILKTTLIITITVLNAVIMAIVTE